MIRPRSTLATSQAAAAAKCQRCLQTGHWTYDCKNEPNYSSRPSRTAQLLNPPHRHAEGPVVEEPKEADLPPRETGSHSFEEEKEGEEEGEENDEVLGTEDTSESNEDESNSSSDYDSEDSSDSELGEESESEQSVDEDLSLDEGYQTKRPKNLGSEAER